jgi:hypothetical protein
MPTFKDTLGIVYILPDSRAIQEVFSFYEPWLKRIDLPMLSMFVV